MVNEAQPRKTPSLLPGDVHIGGCGYTAASGQAPSLRRSYMSFAKAAHRALPELGNLHTAEGGAAVDPECGFWVNGRRRYLNLLRRYIGNQFTRLLLASLENASWHVCRFSWNFLFKQMGDSDNDISKKNVKGLLGELGKKNGY